MKSLIVSFVLLVSFLSCESGPVPINYNEDECHYCKMIISDERFGAELVTKKGRVYKYDAIECLIPIVLKQGEEKFSDFLVTDFYNPKKLIDAKAAAYLISKELPSPMGGFLSAFSSTDFAGKLKMNIKEKPIVGLHSLINIKSIEMRRTGIITILFLLSSKLIFAEKHTVCATCDIQNIESAVDIYCPYDSIVIHVGKYEIENIVLDRPVFLIGMEGAELISRSGDEIITVLANSVSIEGLTFKNVTTSYLKERSAIRIKKQKDFKIKNNKIIDCFFGIYLEHAKRGEIKNNSIFGNATTEAESGNGIHSWYSKDIFISENYITGQRDGIYFEFVSNSQIENNTSERNKRYGLHFMFSNDNEYLNNIFNDNGVGVAVMFSRKIIMQNNQFRHNWGRAAYGLLLKEINDAEIIGNLFEQNTTGIFVEGSNRINYNKNDFNANGWAIKFSGGCSANSFTENNLTNNSLDLVVASKLTGNEFYNNFWGNYSGYDLNHDGFGDVPHYPVKLFSYILDQCPETIVLMRSLFVDIINFSERVSPVFTPKDVFDRQPKMYQIR